MARACLGLRASSTTLGKPLHSSLPQVVTMPTSRLTVQMKGQEQKCMRKASCYNSE